VVKPEISLCRMQVSRFPRSSVAEESNSQSFYVRPSTIKVAIIEDRRDIREGLATLINGTEGYRCASAFRSMEEALEMIARNLPDVALVDIGLPGMSGIDGIAILKERHRELALLMLSVYDDDDRIFDALCAGACGYLLKNTPPARLLASLEEAV